VFEDGAAAATWYCCLRNRCIHERTTLDNQEANARGGALSSGSWGSAGLKPKGARLSVQPTLRACILPLGPHGAEAAG